jgi:hypothetical protein
LLSSGGRTGPTLPRSRAHSARRVGRILVQRLAFRQHTNTRLRTSRLERAPVPDRRRPAQTPHCQGPYEGVVARTGAQTPMHRASLIDLPAGPGAGARGARRAHAVRTAAAPSSSKAYSTQFPPPSPPTCLLTGAATTCMPRHRNPSVSRESRGLRADVSLHRGPVPCRASGERTRRSARRRRDPRGSRLPGHHT